MHVGYRCYFQNPDGRLSDAEVDQQELRLAEVAEPLASIPSVPSSTTSTTLRGRTFFPLLHL